MFDDVEHVLAGERERPGTRGRLHGELVDVSAGHEGLVAGAREDHRPDALILLEIEHRPAERLQRLRVQGVADLGAVERDGRDRPVALEEQNV